MRICAHEINIQIYQFDEQTIRMYVNLELCQGDTIWEKVKYNVRLNQNQEIKEITLDGCEAILTTVHQTYTIDDPTVQNQFYKRDLWALSPDNVIVLLASDTIDDVRHVSMLDSYFSRILETFCWMKS